jgi:hypothetical protein
VIARVEGCNAPTAIATARERYCGRAVETPAQAQLIHDMIHVRTHPFPVWGHHADGVVYARVNDETYPGYLLERIPTRTVSADCYEICAIPVFARNLALGDLVTASPDEAGRLMLIDVKRRSGRFDYRLWFGEIQESDREATRGHVIDKLEEIGCVTEHYSNDLLCVDAPNAEIAQQFVDFALQYKHSGLELEAANE